MGGDLRKAPSGKCPSFLVAAMKDAYSGNLDRIQIVKGWLDASGKTHERVYDVAWSGDRKPGADGKLPRGGQHGGRAERDLDQHDRRAGADRHVDRSGIRCERRPRSTTRA